mmetsp:Transcript_32364/g.45127  ORF Transcript_32364/g.45127 Transcript_32364/m.45127 type:complete len:243 (+) Transcript_32364:281-1009(+)
MLVRICELELGSAGQCHDGIENTELSCSQRSNHHTSRAKASEAELHESGLIGQTSETGHDGSLSTGSLLVDEGEQGVCGVRDDGSSNTGNHTRGKRDCELGSLGSCVGVDSSCCANVLSCNALYGKLGHGVRNLLEKDRAESGVETLDETIFGEDLGECANEAASVFRVGNQTNTGCLERTEENVRDELSASSCPEVDRNAKLPRPRLAELRSKVDLEELNTTKLKPPLDKVSNDSRAETSG